jgi:transcriptional regulator with XRE-family HTH domain
MVGCRERAREDVMDRSEVQSRIVEFREERMWTQGRLAEEAGVSPTTVSGIESGRISRPHFGTVKKLARALGVEPRELLSARANGAPRGPLSFGWAMSSRKEKFEEGLEEASLGGLLGLSRELGEEYERLRRLYSEARGVEQRRLIKGRICDVAASTGPWRLRSPTIRFSSPLRRRRIPASSCRIGRLRGVSRRDGTRPLEVSVYQQQERGIPS